MRSLLRVSWFLAFAAVPLALPSFAQAAEPVVNGIGIYFDQSGTSNCANAQPYTPVTMYLLAIGISETSGIFGWESGVFTNPATLPVPLTVAAPGCLAGCTLPYLRATLGTPLPRASVITLATMSTFYVGGTIWIGVGAYQPTSFPGNPGPGYVAGDGSGRLIRLTPYFCTGPATGDPAWVAGIGAPGCCPTPVEDESWGAIKGLYQ